MLLQIEIAVEARKIATAYFEAQFVTRQEDVADGQRSMLNL